MCLNKFFRKVPNMHGFSSFLHGFTAKVNYFLNNFYFKQTYITKFFNVIRLFQAYYYFSNIWPIQVLPDFFVYVIWGISWSNTKSLGKT